VRKINLPVKLNLLRRFFYNPLPGPFLYNKTIFIHIPKSAGTSISLGLYGFQVGHKKYSDYYFISPQKCRDFFSFSFVRDPLDRLYSAFCFLKNGGLTANDKRFSLRELRDYDSFELFVNEWLNDESIYRYVHFLPQYIFLNSSVSKRDPTPMVNFIGRFEDINNDIEKLSEMIGLDDVRIHKKNCTRNKPSLDISEKARNKVKDIYDVDYNLFGY
jgi:hypothetical protein